MNVADGTKKTPYNFKCDRIIVYKNTHTKEYKKN